MDEYELFKNSLKKAASEFRSIDKNEIIRVISHLDADGLCSAAIIIKALSNENRKYILTILPTLREENIRELSEENYKNYIFTDLGSSTLDELSEFMQGKNIFILDHHIVQGKLKKNSDIVHINPLLFGIESNEISGAGVTFLFSSFLSPKNNMAHIAVIGAIGDAQENNGFRELNNEILEIAVANKKILVKKGLRFFGFGTRPLYKLLQYGTDLYIPNVTGSESGSVQFLIDLGINPKDKKGVWRKISDLNDEEKKKLIEGIIVKRSSGKMSSETANDIFTKIYILNDEDEDSMFRDAKEFATLLNACGRMGKPSIGVGVCLNNKEMKELAVKTMNDYRREIVESINWFRDNEHSRNVINGKNYVIINAGNNIRATIIGTLASMLAKSNEFSDNFIILALAHNDDNTTKVSLRVAGKTEENLQEIIEKIISKTGGSSGGHIRASGAVIETEKEDEFVEAAVRVLEETGNVTTLA